MNVFQVVFEAIESLNSNKVRSALTMLGIIIGVASVVAMMAIGAGAQASITSQINSIGTNLLYVAPGGDAAHPNPLTIGDAKALGNPGQVPTAGIVAPTLRGNISVSVPGQSRNVSMSAVTPEFFQVQSADVAEGVSISQKNVDSIESVALIGSTTATNLFNTTTGLIGKTIRLNGQIFTIAGVLKSQGGTGFGNNDDRVIVPLTTAQLRLVRRSRPDQVDLIYVQARDSDSVKATQDTVTSVMRSRHKTGDGKDDFTILSTQSFLDTANAVTGILTVFLGGVAGVSLLVGGIGIMNIMLVTVTERTREIGLRKAIGARKSDIRVQFLVESLLLSLGGGAIGVLTGWGISTLVGNIAASSGTTLNPIVQMNAVLLATLFSAAIGVFFGLYPANRAANLEPVEALRSE
jgi:putative ABC transport system permease protein